MPTITTDTLFQYETTFGHLGDIVIQVVGTGITYDSGLPNGGTLTEINITMSGTGNDISLRGFDETDIAVLAALNYTITDPSDIPAFVAQFTGAEIFLNGAQYFGLMRDFDVPGVVNGSSGEDYVDMSSGDDTFLGNGGDDEGYGYGGNDTMDGGAGNDGLYGGSGNDSIEGGAGNDYIEGDDYDYYYNFFAVTEVGAMGEDMLFGGAGRDDIYGYGGADLIDGGVGNDDLNGGMGNDTIFGGEGNDDIRSGSSFNDMIDDDDDVYGGLGRDDINTGNGNDLIFGGDGADFIRAGQGDDKVRGGAHSDNMTGARGDDNMLGGRGQDIMFGGTGDSGRFFEDETDNDFMRGQKGADEMYGGMDDDDMSGNKGADALFGGAGSDILKGGKGADILQADTGFLFFGKPFAVGLEEGEEMEEIAPDMDSMRGGAGADIFAFNDFEQPDFDDEQIAYGYGPMFAEQFVVIEDFTDGKDKLMMLNGNFMSAAKQYSDFKKYASQDGDDVVVETQSTTVTILNASLDDFSAEDFVFSPGTLGGGSDFFDN